MLQAVSSLTPRASHEPREREIHVRPIASDDKLPCRRSEEQRHCVVRQLLYSTAGCRAAPLSLIRGSLRSLYHVGGLSQTATALLRQRFALMVSPFLHPEVNSDLVSAMSRG